jgi:hypothetical protein
VPSPGTLLFAPKVGVLRPGDENNYEMSDKGDEEDEEDGEEEDEEEGGGPKKTVPEWAYGAALAAAIHAQYGEGGIDPDTLFPEVSTCDLEAVFGQRKKRYAKRTSSGNWHQDRLTAGERSRYRADMGYAAAPPAGAATGAAGSSSSSSSAAMPSAAATVPSVARER